MRVVNRFFGIISVMICFVSCDHKLKEAEKNYDKLELDFSSEELIKRLDRLEQDLKAISENFYVGFSSSDIWFNEYGNFIKSENVNFEYLKNSPLTKGLFTSDAIQNIVDLYKILSRNQISIQDFTFNYWCNGETIIWYKKNQCGANNYCERRLYIRKGETVEFRCFNNPNDLLGSIDNMTPIDSIGNIFLLKPERYLR